MYYSYSSTQKYLSCPKKWQLYYQEKLRSTNIGSALFFGSALDEAFNRLLLDKADVSLDKSKFTSILDKTAIEVFEESFSKILLNEEVIRISHSSKALYYKSDCDLSLLNTSDKESIIDFAQDLKIDVQSYDDIDLFIDGCNDVFRAKTQLGEEPQRLYNYICWSSLKRKGLMILDTYEKEIIPKIHKVYDIQKKIEIKDGGDSLIGYIDFIASFTDDPDTKYIIDNKTSSQPYKDDSVRISEQLSLYSEHEDLRNCAYIVAEKKIRKRDPRVRVNIIRDSIPEEMIETTFNNISEVFYGIEEKTFDKDFDACYSYGRKCEYYNYCRDGSLKDLVYKNKKEK